MQLEFLSELLVKRIYLGFIKNISGERGGKKREAYNLDPFKTRTFISSKRVCAKNAVAKHYKV